MKIEIKYLAQVNDDKMNKIFDEGAYREIGNMSHEEADLV